MMISFTVPGVPVPQSRPRFTRQGRAYDTKACKAYKRQVAMAAKAAMGAQEPLQGAIGCYVVFYFEPPKNTSKKKFSATIGTWYTKKKDTDNLLKGVTDAISGIVYVDDGQIVSLRGEKKYGYPARVEVEIHEEET